MDNSNKNNSYSKNRKYVFFSATLIILLIVGVLIYILLNQTNAHGQIVDFKQAAKDKEYNKISEYLSSGQRDLSKDEGKVFVSYINKPKNIKRFNKEINEREKNVKDNNQYDVDMGSITDNNEKK